MSETSETTTTTGPYGTRAEHLQWCKDRALVYADQGDMVNAVASMTSDLRKHPETENHAGAQLMVVQAMAGLLDRPGELRRCIEGFR
jgi:hypothetical protein